MIEAIIFDLGDVFLNLNHQASTDAFKKLGLNAWTDDLKSAAILFETGKIDEMQFMETIQKHIPNANLVEIREAWNAIIGDFPLERLEFLEKLQNKYNIFLLSNTNPTHIDKFEHRDKKVKEPLVLKQGELEYKLKFNCKPCEMEIWEKDAEFEIEDED